MEDQERVKKHKFSSETKSNSIKILHRPPYVPEEIVRNILCPLPIKSLLRFKCISKPWSRWISETTRSTGNNKKLLLSDPYRKKYPTERTIDQTGLVEVVHVPFDKMLEKMSKIVRPSKPRYMFHSSCNGLLLISIDKDLFLCNLATRRFSRILRCKYLSSSYSSFTIVGDLCFDSDTDDYMVVMTVCGPKHEFVTVGSARNKSWKKIHFPYHIPRVNRGVILNNRLHSCTTDKNNQSDHIIYFDPKRYEFVELPVPETEDKRVGRIFIEVLGVLNGCLYMACRRNCTGYHCDYDVLIMREYGVKESWTLLFKVHGVDCFQGFKPFFYTTRRKHEVLMSLSRSCLVTHDIERQVHTEKFSDYYFESRIVYEETLVEPPTYGAEDPLRRSSRRRRS